MPGAGAGADGRVITASTRVVALLGHPVAHSVSPQLHNAAFAATGIDAVYVAWDVAPADIDDALLAVGALGLLGANITVPHKRAAFLTARARTADATASGAANTLFWDGGTLTADNTDVAGLQTVLAEEVSLRPGDQALLLGTGGVARAAALALGRAGATVEVVGRRADAAADIGALISESGGRVTSVENPRVAINATPLGMHGESPPERFVHLTSGQVALDLVYGPAPTPFLRSAKAGGATAVDGRGLLVAQAAAAFSRWTGVPAPVDVMSAAVDAALRERD